MGFFKNRIHLSATILILACFLLPILLKPLAPKEPALPYTVLCASWDMMLHPSPSDANIAAFVQVPKLEQFAAVASFFVIKMFYTLLCVILLIPLLKNKHPLALAVRNTLFAFFLGEMACFFNVLILRDFSQIMDFLHSAGMAVTFAFASYAFLLALDHFFIHYSSSNACAFSKVCGACVKTDPTLPCHIRQITLALLLGLIVLCFIPINSPYRTDLLNTRIFGVLHTYYHTLLTQTFELRFLPIAAIICFALSFLLLWKFEKHPAPFSRLFLVAGLGALGFSYFRLILVAIFIKRLVWFDFWEEATECLFILLIAWLLFVFKKTIMPTSSPCTQGEGKSAAGVLTGGDRPTNAGSLPISYDLAGATESSSQETP